MLKIAICDDDVTLCSRIEECLISLGHKYSQKIEISIFYSGKSIIKYMKDQESFDLLYLDIELGDMTGMDVADTIRSELNDNTIQIVYVSAKEEYAMKLFDTRPMNFLIKPVSSEKMEEVFAKACELLQVNEEYFTYGLNHKTYRQPIKDIIYFESKEKKIRMVLKDEEILFYSRLKLVEEQVEKTGFINIHKSYIVNPNQVMKYEYTQLTMSDGSILPISKSKRSKIRQIMMSERRGL